MECQIYSLASLTHLRSSSKSVTAFQVPSGNNRQPPTSRVSFISIIFSSNASLRSLWNSRPVRFRLPSSSKVESNSTTKSTPINGIDTIEFFCSYGSKIDEPLTWTPVGMRVQLGQDKPYLSNLLDKSPYRVIYNPDWLHS